MDDKAEQVSIENEEFTESTDTSINKVDLLTTNPKVVLDVSKPKSCKRGIVYLSYIPEGMNVKNIRQLLSKYGEVERIYLERNKTLNKAGKFTKSKYVEGWVEFKKKSVAKMVASTLNGTSIGGKRRTLFYGALWNLKYLKRFKWSHLAEQMAYEKALREQKLRLEVDRAKKESTFYVEMIQRSRNKKEIYNDPNRHYKQRATDEQIRLQKQQQQQTDELDQDLLASIFK